MEFATSKKLAEKEGKDAETGQGESHFPLGGGLDEVEPKIVEITHLCIMHGAHINIKGRVKAYLHIREAAPEAGRTLRIGAD